MKSYYELRKDLAERIGHPLKNNRVIYDCDIAYCCGLDVSILFVDTRPRLDPSNYDYQEIEQIGWVHGQLDMQSENDLEYLIELIDKYIDQN